MIKFLDLKKINSLYKKDLEKKALKVIDSGQYILGKEVDDFEKNFANYCKTKFCIGVASGLDALSLVFRAWIEMGKLKKGDHVIVPSNTYIASILAITNNGLKPILVEPDLETFNISPELIKKNISKKTKAILVVHLYGRVAEMTTIKKIAKDNNLLVLEDCAQAHGAKLKNKMTGSFGDAGAFSFYPGKNLGAWGDGGAVTTNSKSLKEKMTAIRSYGSEKKYYHKYFGFNSRLQPFQGVVLSKKLKDINSWNKERRNIAHIYNDAFKDNSRIVVPQIFNQNTHVWHLYVLRVKNRNKLIENSMSMGVETSIHYPLPIHRQKAYKEHSQFNKKIKNADSFSKQLISLPIFPKMKESEVEKVVDTISKLA